MATKDSPFVRVQIEDSNLARLGTAPEKGSCGSKGDLITGWIESDTEAFGTQGKFPHRSSGRSFPNHESRPGGGAGEFSVRTEGPQSIGVLRMLCEEFASVRRLAAIDGLEIL